MTARTVLITGSTRYVFICDRHATNPTVNRSNSRTTNRFRQCGIITELSKNDLTCAQLNKSDRYPADESTVDFMILERSVIKFVFRIPVGFNHLGIADHECPLGYFKHY